MKPTNWLLTTLTKGVLAIVEVMYPTRTKRGRRILFLSSFNAACVKDGVLQENTLKTLNDALSVSQDPDTLDLGFRMSPSIWSRNDINNMFPEGLRAEADDEKIQQYITLNQAQEFTENVLKQTPPWLRYDHDEMRSDVIDLFTGNEVRLP